MYSESTAAKIVMAFWGAVVIGLVCVALMSASIVANGLRDAGKEISLNVQKGIILNYQIQAAERAAFKKQIDDAERSGRPVPRG